MDGADDGDVAASAFRLSPTLTVATVTMLLVGAVLGTVLFQKGFVPGAPLGGGGGDDGAPYLYITRYASRR